MCEFRGKHGAAIFNFYLLKNKTTHVDGDRQCKELGYDGLASFSFPEAYRYGLEITEPYRTASPVQVNIGLYLHKPTSTLYWAEGSPVTSDVPWRYPPPDTTGKLPYGKMARDGKFIMKNNDDTALSLCGNCES
ncbi:hypothetical protein PoB_002785300 [Plakobranchus ocellatus]|uniref:C-type lectin domain-containing protein n=1 Tax=Plakobranchus ocellatus TaxID=259542 RepID=A0AAV4A3X0_9GAST|nr:hypothetical protein PoB_002785300 [Plakobranchus ocellatus]